MQNIDVGSYNRIKILAGRKVLLVMALEIAKAQVAKLELKLFKLDAEMNLLLDSEECN